MNRYSDFYLHNYEDFIIINRPKYGSRILRLYWEIYLEKNLGFNLFINRMMEPSFLNLYTISDSNEQYLPYNSIFSNTDGRFETLESQKEDFFKHESHPDLIRLGIEDKINTPEYEEHRQKAFAFFYDLNKKNTELLSKIWKGHQIDKPVYVIYRNPEKHFKSGLLQDVGYHEFVNVLERTVVGHEVKTNKEKCFELFDTELSDSGYVGNHRGNYLSMLMPNIYHLNNMKFFNLDGLTKLDFSTIFETELGEEEVSYYKKKLYKIGKMTEAEHRTESSHVQAYPVVNEYFKQHDVNTKFHQFYFADNIWYNKLIRDNRNIISSLHL